MCLTLRFLLDLQRLSDAMGITEKANGSNGGVAEEQLEQHDECVLRCRNEATVLTACNSGKMELTEDAGYQYLGFCYPTWRKWQILGVMFAS